MFSGSRASVLPAVGASTALAFQSASAVNLVPAFLAPFTAMSAACEQAQDSLRKRWRLIDNRVDIHSSVAFPRIASMTFRTISWPGYAPVAFVRKSNTCRDGWEIT